MKQNNVTDAQRAEVVARWRRAAAKVNQKAFVAEIRQDLGINISTRTLRAWCERFGGTANAEHVKQARAAVQDMLRKVSEVEERLRAALVDLDAQQEVSGQCVDRAAACSCEEGGARRTSEVGKGPRKDFFSDVANW